jgi:hypothetical protein
MLASVLHSQRAIEVNIQIVRAFLRMRDLLNSQNMILTRLQKVETGQNQQGERISLIFKLLKEVEKAKEKELDHRSRNKVGFKRSGEQ